MGGPNKPQLPGLRPSGPIPYGEDETPFHGSDQYSQQTNYNMRFMNPNETENNYRHASGPEYDQYEDGMNQVVGQMRQLFGAQTTYEILRKVIELGASEDINGPTLGKIDRSMMDPPDFGDQQPVTTLPPTDDYLMGLESYYGYPVQAVQPDTPPGRPVYNSYPGMPKPNFVDRAYTQMGAAEYAGRGTKRRLPKPKR